MSWPEPTGQKIDYHDVLDPHIHPAVDFYREFMRHDLLADDGVPLFPDEASYPAAINYWYAMLCEYGFLLYLQLRPIDSANYVAQSIRTAMAPRVANIQGLRNDSPSVINVTISGVEFSLDKEELLAGKVWMPLKLFYG